MKKKEEEEEAEPQDRNPRAAAPVRPKTLNFHVLIRIPKP
jgi:hypothetical protein